MVHLHGAQVCMEKSMAEGLHSDTQDAVSRSGWKSLFWAEGKMKQKYYCLRRNES